MKVFRRIELDGRDYKMLLNTGMDIRREKLFDSDRLLFLSRKGLTIMDYNELKLRVLRMFDEGTELDSFQVRDQLRSAESLPGQKSVEMALMRYWRQGLLARVRKGRRFYYKLTKRGIARRVWLAGQNG